MTALRPLPAEDLERALSAVPQAAWRGLADARIFLTGGTGFVGKWLLATLLEARRRFAPGLATTVLSRDPARFASEAPQLAAAPGVTLARGDVRDFAFPPGRFSHVVHAATDVVAQNSPQDTFATCVDGTRRVLDFAAHAGVADFLLVSSGAVYGRQPPELDRLPEHWPGAPDPLQPGSAYGEGKRVAEWLASTQAAQTGLRVRVARCFAFVGPYLPLDKHFAVGNFLRDAMAGREIVIQGDGTPWRSYLHAADMAGWLWATLLQGRPGTAYNVGGEEPVSIAQLAHRVVRVLGSDGGVRVLKAADPARLAERYVPDVGRALGELNLPAPLGLDEAIARTARWHEAP